VILIADSSPLIALAVCDGLFILEELYSEIIIPEAVYQEITYKEKKYSELFIHLFKDKVVHAHSLFINDYSLGKGELEAILLYKELKADLLLIDDKRARKIAHLNEIKTIGSLGLLFEAKEKKIITSLYPFVLKIYKSDIFISKKLCNYILLQSGETLFD